MATDDSNTPANKGELVQFGDFTRRPQTPRVTPPVQRLQMGGPLGSARMAELGARLEREAKQSIAAFGGPGDTAETPENPGDNVVSLSDRLGKGNPSPSR